MIRLAEGVYSWGAFNDEKGMNFNGHLVVRGQETLVVDPPPHTQNEEKFLERALKARPTLVVATNKHHLRDARWWMERYGAPLAMHESEENDFGFSPARRIKDGDEIAAGCRVVHLPGKTPGEFGLYIKASGGTLIVGDALIGHPAGALKIPPDDKLQSRAELVGSLQKLRELSFERLLVGDGEPLLSGAKAAVLAFLDGLKA